MKLMPDGWGEYKKRVIEDQINHFNEKFQLIEQFIKSPIERIAFSELFNWKYELGLEKVIKLNVQQKFGPFIVDIHLCCKHGGKITEIVVECDGHDFHEKTKRQVSRDKERDRYFTKKGFFLLRYSGSDLVRKPSTVVSDIEEILEKRHPYLFNSL
jgi:very-short-patch-repair endonuclease